MMLLLNLQYFPFFGLNSKKMFSFYRPRELKSVHLEAVIPVPYNHVSCNIRPDASDINALDRAGGIGPE
jgi:hypothetical protein